MSIGHVKLGESGNLRAYALTDPAQYRAQPINPMAAKILQGAGSYDDFMGWAFWVMEDWQSGVGRRASEGALFGDVATMMSGRLTLPLHGWPVNAVDQAGYGHLQYPWAVHGLLEIGAGQRYTKIAQPIASTAGMSVQQIWVLLEPLEAGTVTLERGTGSTPTEVVASRTVMGETQPGAQWLLLDLGSSQVLSSGWNYWVCVSGRVRAPYEYTTNADGRTLVQTLGYDGAGWAATTVSGQAVTCCVLVNLIEYGLAAGGWSAEEIADTVQWAGSIWVYGRANLYRLTPGEALWRNRFTLQSSQMNGIGVQDLCVHGDALWGAAGAGGLWERTTGGSESELLVDGQRFPVSVLESWNGYLWAAHGNELWYSGDGSTWTGPIEVGPPGYEVRSMAGLGDYFYLATDEGLWRLAPGDVIEGVTPWPSISASNGRRMVVHAGAIYVPMRNRIWMFSLNGALQDVWMDAGVDLPSGYVGEIASLATTHLGLVATVNPVDAALSASVWVLGSEGWHVLAVLPPNMGAGRVVVDAINNRLWVATRCGLMWSIYFEPLAVLPVRNPAQPWGSQGWLEWDWYAGDLVDVDKDWESVSIFGEGLSANQPVEIYYRTEDGGAWQLAGVATGENVEVRFAMSQRPLGAKIKLGLLLRTNNWHYTPVVRAIRVKYQPMLFDRWRWQLALPVHDEQEMPDGSINPYTAADVRQHLEGLIARAAPALFEDLDGTQYEVKVVGATRNVEGWSWLAASARAEMRWVYALTLEQVTAGRYLPALTTVRTVYGWWRLGANESLRVAGGGWLRVEANV